MEPLEAQLAQLVKERDEFKRSAELQISWYQGGIDQLEQLLLSVTVPVPINTEPTPTEPPNELNNA